jgi:hypothetical protein
VNCLNFKDRKNGKTNGKTDAANILEAKHPLLFLGPKMQKVKEPRGGGLGCPGHTGLQSVV